ncbi:Cytochrome b-c1 complex subunit 8, mitochondrial [Saitoella coloradoensis]
MGGGSVPEGTRFMGWWGNMGGPTQRGIVTYSLSPFAQRPLAGTLHAAIFNSARRIRQNIFYWGVPMAAYYGIYTWANSYNEFLNSKAGHLAEAQHEIRG